MPTRLLLLADTHVPARARALPEPVLRAVASLGPGDLLVHAGDWVAGAVLDELTERAGAAGWELLGVAGNNDGPALRARLPEVARAERDGVRLAVVHETGAATGRERRCALRFPDADLLVFGHSHVPWDSTAQHPDGTAQHPDGTGLRLLNPGSPTDRRRQPAATFMTALLEAGRVHDVVLHRLPVRPVRGAVPGGYGRPMRALTWQGKRKVSVETVPDPVVQEPTDAVIRVTSTGLCGSDLHLYEVMGPFLDAGDVLGHEPMGVVEEVGSQVTHIRPGDRVVVPFNISCGSCAMCTTGLQSQCETTQNRERGFGADLFGYTKLYGQVPGGQAEYLRVPQAHYGPVKVPDGVPDDRYLYLSDVLPTAWQAVRYAGVDGRSRAEGGITSLVVLGLGPIGDMCTRVAAHLGVDQVVGIDPVADRRTRVAARGTRTIDPGAVDDLVGAVRDLTGGRGADAVIDAVGMEAHGSAAKAAHTALGFVPDAVAQKMMLTMGVDRLTALHTAVDLVRRGGTVSLSGVYGGAADPMPMLYMFDRQLQLRMGQANVHRWVPEILPLLGDDDPLGVDDFATHRVPLEQAPQAYEAFQQKTGGTVKVVFTP